MCGFLADVKFLLVFLQSEVEETLKRIQGQKGVQGIIIVNSEGEDTHALLTLSSLASPQEVNTVSQ